MNSATAPLPSAAKIIVDLRRRGFAVSLTGPQNFDVTPDERITEADDALIVARKSGIIAALHGAENLRRHGHVPYTEDPNVIASTTTGFTPASEEAA